MSSASSQLMTKYSFSLVWFFYWVFLWVFYFLFFLIRLDYMIFLQEDSLSLSLWKASVWSFCLEFFVFFYSAYVWLFFIFWFFSHFSMHSTESVKIYTSNGKSCQGRKICLSNTLSILQLENRFVLCAVNQLFFFFLVLTKVYILQNLILIIQSSLLLSWCKQSLIFYKT